MTHRKDRRSVRQPVEAIHISRADWRQAYQDALRIAKHRDGEGDLADALLNDPLVRSNDIALQKIAAAVEAPGYSMRVA